VGERIIEDRREERPGMTASMSFSMEDGMVVVEDVGGRGARTAVDLKVRGRK
jgi:hypothetical protein